MSKKKFPQDKEYELSLLLNGDPAFKALTAYLDPCIKMALDNFLMSPGLENRLHREIVADIPIAAERFLQKEPVTRDYEFSRYFSWYIAQHINQERKLVRKTRPSSDVGGYSGSTSSAAPNNSSTFE